MSSGNLDILTRGILKNNPTFKLILGLCPTLAVTTSLTNSFTMGIATSFVLVLSSIIVSMIKGFVPGKIRIPSYIVVISTLVTVVDMALAASVPDVHERLGIYVPLIVVNCIILGRAEAFASKEKVYKSALDGIGMSIGFILSICLIGIIRELFGTGSIMFFNQIIIDTGITNMPVVMILGPGAFLTLGLLLALFNYLNNKNGESGING